MLSPTMRILKAIGRVVFAGGFIVAGVCHFIYRDFFVSIVPPSLPWPAALVYISGVAAILLGGLLMAPRTARVAGWGLIALLIAVFPANVQMALHADRYPAIPAIALWIRLPLQGVLVALAYWFAEPARPE